MKLELDTTNKVIKISDSVNLKELVDMVKKLLPDNWREFELRVDPTITWVNPQPIWIDRYPPYRPYDVWYTNRGSDNSGTYQLELNR